MTALVVTACGPMTSLQDRGRFGAQRLGISSSGAMDALGLAAANVLVGNAPGAAAIELGLLGGSFTVEDGVLRAAVAGALCAVTLDGRTVPTCTSVTLSPGRILSIGPARAGVFAYLGVGSGFDISPQLGSLSLQPRAGLGGLNGRFLQPGDRLPLLKPAPPAGLELELDPPALDATAPVRVVLGPQDDYFAAEAVGAFLSSPYTVSREADRMGYRLTGPAVRHARGYNIVSDGIVSGSVQVPGSGEPIVKMADRQTTGGYPKIATMISADLRVLAQRRPGETVRFEAVSMAEAQRIARERAAIIAGLAASVRPFAKSLSVEALLALNLAGAAVDALAPED